MEANKKEILIFTLSNLALLLLSLLGLIWGDWEIIMCLGIGVVFGGLNFILFIFTADQSKSSSSIYIYAILRYLSMFIGIIVPAVILYFTQTDSDTKLRYLNLLGATIPFVINVIIAGFIGGKDFKEKGEKK